MKCFSSTLTGIGQEQNEVMSEELFDVVFFGILQAGKDKETVMQNMAALFKTDASKLAPYFAGGRKVIKGKVNAAAAEKYRSALENVGLVIKVEPCTAAQRDNDSKAQEKVTDDRRAEAADKDADTKADIDTSGITVAPVGADVLENPVEKPAQMIGDISDITMAEVGADVLENPVEKPAQKIEDISDITIAEVGADVLDHSPEVVPQPIDDISDITLAEPGVDIIENPKPKEKAKIPDTSELTLDDPED
jgi:hypothetical protein